MSTEARRERKGAGSSRAVTSDVENSVTRVEHDGRVYRWERPGGAWPGHTCSVALLGREVVMSDRYAGDRVTRSYRCTPEDLLEGCFHAEITEQLGGTVLLEVLAEVRHQLGLPAELGAPSRGASARPGPTPAPAPGPANAPAKAASGPESGAPAPAPPPPPLQPASASAPASAPESAPQVTATGPDAAAARVSVTLVACPPVDLAVAMALRAVTRASVSELLPRLRALPCVLLPDVSWAEGEAAAQRLRERGLTIELSAG